MKSAQDIQAEVHAGASALEFDKQFAGAQNHILLHAAIYNRFAENAAVSNALEFALARREVALQAILLPVWRDLVWMDDACRLVRPEGTREELLQKAEVSREFFLRLAEKYPQQVTIYEGKTFPAFPLVIVDEIIFCGHYAHSHVLPPEGLWIQVSAPVNSLLHLAESATPRSGYCVSNERTLCTQGKGVSDRMSSPERAVFRYLQEWTAAKGAVISQ